MARNVKFITDADYRFMDGWPAPLAGGRYPDAGLIEVGRIYTEEEEKCLHRKQDKQSCKEAKAKVRFQNGTDR